MRAGGNLLILFVSLVVFGVARVCDADRLQENFYKESCPQAEELVRDITWRRAQTNPDLGAQLLRLHNHDCFVRGCDASILLDTVGATESEKEIGPNRSLLGFDVIDEIKTQIEQVCPGVVSCADILSLAARDSVSFPFKKPMWDVLTGRRDGTVSLASEADGNISSPFSDFTTLKRQFEEKGLNVKDLVALSGAHTLGSAHCGTFSNRLYNFNGNAGEADPSLDPPYAQFLRTKCPERANRRIRATPVEMDPLSSHSFDSNYFDILVQNKGLFQSDAALLTDSDAAQIVIQLQTPDAFFSEFAKSIKKMGAIEVLTGNLGEIRKQCHVVNS